jgi:hypothetical protein
MTAIFHRYPIQAFTWFKSTHLLVTHYQAVGLESLQYAPEYLEVIGKTKRVEFKKTNGSLHAVSYLPIDVKISHINSSGTTHDNIILVIRDW